MAPSPTMASSTYSASVHSPSFDNSGSFEKSSSFDLPSFINKELPPDPPGPRRRFSLGKLLGGICSPKESGRGAAAGSSASTAASKKKNISGDVDLTTSQKDSVFRYQMDFENPKPLGPFVFYVAGLVGNINNSPRVLDTLKEFSILSHHAEDPTVYTSRITRKFTHQLPFLSLSSQRLLISLLFFWEEELSRWTTLEQAALEVEEDLREATEAKLASEEHPEQTGDFKETQATLRQRIQELTIARTRIKTLYGMIPSSRGLQKGSNDSTDHVPRSPGPKGKAHQRTPSSGSWQTPSITRMDGTRKREESASRNSQTGVEVETGVTVEGVNREKFAVKTSRREAFK